MKFKFLVIKNRVYPADVELRPGACTMPFGLHQTLEISRTAAEAVDPIAGKPAFGYYRACWQDCDIDCPAREKITQAAARERALAAVKKVKRYPDEVSINALYIYLWQDLWDSGLIPPGDGLAHAFSKKQIGEALADQGIVESEMEKAIEYCTRVTESLEKRKKSFFLTKKGIEDYYRRLKSLEIRTAGDSCAGCS